MSSQHVKDEILTGYLAGELSAKERHDADTHFSVCPACAARLEEQRDFENKIVRAYPGEFQDRLSHEARLAVGDEIKAGFQPDSAAPVKWESRIRGKFLIQAASVVFVGAILCVMLFFPFEKAEQQEIPPESEIPKADAPVPDKELDALPQKVLSVVEDAVKDIAALPDKGTARSDKAAELPAFSRTPSPPAAPAKLEMKKAVAGRSAAAVPAPAPSRNVAQSDGLMKLLRVGEVTLETKVEPPEKSLFVLTVQNVKSPFSENTFVVYAEAVPKAGKDLDLNIVPAPSAQFSALRTKDTPRIGTAVFDGAELSHFGKIEIHPSDRIPARTICLPVGGGASAIDFSQALPRARLAVILHASSNPYLVLNREVRVKILAELERLLASDYANDPEVKALYERIKRIK